MERQMEHVNTGTAQNVTSAETQKVLRNTYMLLSMTLAFSALTAGISMSVNLGGGAAMIMSLAALAIVWFVLPRTANTAMGLPVVFLFTGLLGAALGPMLNRYLSLPNGSEMVMQALGGTAIIFLSLSAYVLTTKKDFSFMGGFLFVGLMVVIVGAVGAMIASYFFGVDISLFSLVISGAIVLLMSGFILFDTSRIINGGETNYIMATVGLYLNIYNLFTALLHIIGATSDD
ncbi:MAG: Bax inhibitor-1/YccA family protein [Oleispira antarctica]|nr:Bax inhibitor-1/YccA family protein [Oleispira antarctica]MBQ0792464.1 Bax inhibitor-1/YccA family protein [Oleispira antarctica]